MEWRRVKSDPKYEVSSTGLVRSLDRVVSGGFSGSRKKRGKQLSTWICKTTGYPQVMLSDRKKYNVHRLVAGAFLGVDAERHHVNHINGIKTDNRVENLEWVTPAENIAHSFRVLGRRPTGLGLFGGAHPTSKAVIATCVTTGEEVRYECAMDAVRIGGYDSGCISRCIAGKIRSHKGQAWRFADCETA